MKPSKKSTFLDEVIRMKRHVPDANYEVASDMKDKDSRSGLPKGQRSLMSDEIASQARRSPQPDFGTYQPLFKLTEKRQLGAFNLKEDRHETSFIAESEFKAKHSDRFYSAKYSVVEPRIKCLQFPKPINKKLDMIPHFLRERRATHLISPVSHNPLDAFKKTQVERAKFCMSKGSPRSIGQEEAHKKKWVPSPAKYDIKDIEKGWRAISSSPTRSKRH